MKKQKYAKTYWTIEDVHSHREDNEQEPWTDEQAHKWLVEYERYILDAMIEAGNNFIDDTMGD